MLGGGLELRRWDHANLSVRVTVVEPVDVFEVSNSTSSRQRHPRPCSIFSRGSLRIPSHPHRSGGGHTNCEASRNYRANDHDLRTIRDSDGDRNIDRLLNLLTRSRWMPAVAPTRALQQPVHVDNLTAAAAPLLDRAETVNGAFKRAGPEAVSFADSVEQSVRVIGRHARLRSPPLGPSLTAVRRRSRMHLLPRIPPEQVLRTQDGNALDIAHARTHFEYSPRVVAAGGPEEAALVRIEG